MCGTYLKADVAVGYVHLYVCRDFVLHCNHGGRDHVQNLNPRSKQTGQKQARLLSG